MTPLVAAFAVERPPNLGNRIAYGCDWLPVVLARYRRNGRPRDQQNPRKRDAIGAFWKVRQRSFLPHWPTSRPAVSFHTRQVVTLPFCRRLKNLILFGADQPTLIGTCDLHTFLQAATKRGLQ